MGTINQPALYDAVFKAATTKVQRGQAPDRLLMADGLRILRAVSPDYVPAFSDVATRQNYVLMSAVQECFRVRDQATDKNRFTGAAANGAPGPSGGVYFALNQGAVLAEAMHYSEKGSNDAVARNDFDKMMPFDVASRRVSIPYLMAKTAIIVARLTAPKLVADVSLYSQSRNGEVRRFLNEIGKEPNVSPLIVGQNLPDLMLDGNDYSVARAIGHAIQGSYRYAGMLAETSRETERLGESGSNLILFDHNQAILKGLVVEHVLYFFAPGVVGQDTVIKATPI